jgi:hypothetical protein
MTVSQKITGSTAAARNNAVSAVKMSGKSRVGFEFILAAVNSLADAVDDLNERIESDATAASNLSASVAGCYEHAEECARRAKFAATLQLRDDYLNLERGWIKLARSTQANERLPTFEQHGKNIE